MNIRCPRWSLRSMLFAVVVVALLMGMISWRRAERQAVHALWDNAVSVGYQSRAIGPPVTSTRQDGMDWYLDRELRRRYSDHGRVSWLSHAVFHWCDDLCGADLFNRATWARLHGSNIANDRVAAWLAKLGGLEDLELSADRSRGAIDLAEQVRRLPRVEHLELVGFELTDDVVAELAARRELRRLSFHDCTFRPGALEPVGRLPALVGLNGAAMRLQDSDLEQLALKRLVALDLGRTDVTNAGIRHLARCPQLEYLNLRLTRIDDDAVAVLRTLTHLRVLDVRGTWLTEQGIQQLRDALPECWIDEDVSREYIDGERRGPERRHEWDYTHGSIPVVG